jgi:hypothetical protein
LLKAAGTEYGIVVSTNDPDLLRRKLYPLKKTDPAFERICLIIHPNAPDKELIIGVKHNVNAERPGPGEENT